MESRNKLIRIATAIACEPWLLKPSVHRTITEIVAAHLAEDPAVQHALASEFVANPTKREYEMIGDVAVIPLEGVVGRKFSNVLYSSGVTSIDIFQRLVRTAAEDEQVKGILLAVDSPGGVAMGTPEAADEVRSANASKPVVAYVDGQADSAAYWIASQSHAILSTQSADVGCIGCYLALLDSSRAYDLAGLKTELFRSGPFKGMGMAGTTLTDAQREHLQATVDRIAGQFKSEVLSGRGRAIPEDAMDGRSFAVEDAERLGLIDGVTDFAGALLNVREEIERRGAKKGN